MYMRISFHGQNEMTTLCGFDCGQPALVECVVCGLLCRTCDADQHQTGMTAMHQRKGLCGNHCGQPATLSCARCPERVMCADCDRRLHRIPANRSHPARAFLVVAVSAAPLVSPSPAAQVGGFEEHKDDGTATFYLNGQALVDAAAAPVAAATVALAQLAVVPRYVI